ncbi:hypothetical protein GQ457_07G029260 [Hibiscus cannabinus]
MRSVKHFRARPIRLIYYYPLEYLTFQLLWPRFTSYENCGLCRFITAVPVFIGISGLPCLLMRFTDGFRDRNVNFAANYRVLWISCMPWANTSGICSCSCRSI